MKSARPITAVIVGAGHRAMVYASYARKHPGELRIVGVADPDPFRRQLAAETFAVPPENRFESAAHLCERPHIADAAINGTMDPDHVPTSLPLLAAGYDLLLEKPFATDAAEMRELEEAARCHKRRILICHVLRYAPFYAAIRKEVAAGRIGDILNLQLLEHVSYHHVATSYVRGKWRREDIGQSPLLMAKCCHDLDLIAWMKSGIAPRRVSSFGSNFQFRRERAPAGSGTRCLTDCSIEASCPYSAKKLYLDHPNRWGFYVWAGIKNRNPSEAEKVESLKGDNPYGRCVWRCDNSAVDHQTVAIEFKDGSTASLNMVGGAARGSRSIHLVGTRGEIEGKLEESRFVIRRMDPRPGHEYEETEVNLNVEGEIDGSQGAHGGGDLRLVADFVRILRGEEPSLSCTSIDDSVSGHLIGFAAEHARKTGRVVELQPAGQPSSAGPQNHLPKGKSDSLAGEFIVQT